MLDALLSQYRASITLPKLFDDPGLKKIIDDQFATIPGRLKPIFAKHLPLLNDGFAHAYAREFSTADLADILAFGRTEAGRHYLQRSSALMRDPDFAAANTAYMSDLLHASAQATADVKRELTTYIAAHPELAAKLQSEASPTK